MQRILQESQAYKERVIAEAHGEADRFLNVLQEYRKAPDLMRQRLYLETMERVLSSTDKVIIDSNERPGSGAVSPARSVAAEEAVRGSGSCANS